MRSLCLYAYTRTLQVFEYTTRSRITILKDVLFHLVSAAVDVTIHRKHRYVILHSSQNLKQIVLHFAGIFLWFINMKVKSCPKDGRI
jgi:hypothetical protein